MNKTELIAEVAGKANMTKKDAERAFNAFLTTVEEVLKAGDKIQLVGFGTFEVRTRQARKGRNPQTGAEIDIPAAQVPAFKPGKALKDAIEV